MDSSSHSPAKTNLPKRSEATTELFTSTATTSSDKKKEANLKIEKQKEKREGQHEKGQIGGDPQKKVAVKSESIKPKVEKNSQQV